MFLIKYKLVDLSGSIVEEEILPEIFETPAECDVLIERMSSRYGTSAYDYPRGSLVGARIGNLR